MATDTSLCREAFEWREQGLTWSEVGKQLKVPKETARSRARRYAGSMRTILKYDKHPDYPNRNKERKAVLNEALQGYGLSEGEFKAMLSSSKGRPTPTKKVAKRGAKTRSAKLLIVSDTHVGHSKFQYGLWDRVVVKSKDCDMILHPGDHLEGMSGRDGHIYELDAIGYQNQINLCRDLYSQLADKPMYGIDGNHDQWFKAKMNQGVIVGEELERSLKNYTHLGEWEGDLEIDGLRIKLFHANDGTAYAHSYKLQKLVESFSGGKKPHLLFSGHYHKALYQWLRYVHAWESGCILGQTGWMRGKKIQAHIGFWEVVVRWREDIVQDVSMTFVPAFEE